MIHAEFYCPPMPVDRDGPGHKRTQAEPMRFTATEGGVLLVKIDPVIIPPTGVQRIHRAIPFFRKMKWMVDPCIGAGEDDLARVLVELPEEPVVMEKIDGKWWIVAKEIIAPTTMWLAGRVAKGRVKFPDCKTDLRTKVASAVTAIGELEWVQ